MTWYESNCQQVRLLMQLLFWELWLDWERKLSFYIISVLRYGWIVYAVILLFLWRKSSCNICESYNSCVEDYPVFRQMLWYLDQQQFSFMSGFLVNGYQSGLVSRSSAEWINIQKNTFTNWVNEQLRMRGISVHDLRTDLADGVSLVALLEVLQRRRINGAVERPNNPHEVLQNLNAALEAIGEDNVRIVNIGIGFFSSLLNSHLIIFHYLHIITNLKTSEAEISLVTASTFESYMLCVIWVTVIFYCTM